jgi:hypothetical protein
MGGRRPRFPDLEPRGTREFTKEELDLRPRNLDFPDLCLPGFT